jgi:hypothetical protein
MFLVHPTLREEDMFIMANRIGEILMQASNGDAAAERQVLDG